MKKLTAKEYVEANLPKMKEQVAQLEKAAERAKRFNFRAVLGAFIAGPICGGLFALFEETAKTEHWVSEYHNWIVAGVCIVGAAIWSLIVFWPQSRNGSPQ